MNSETPKGLNIDSPKKKKKLIGKVGIILIVIILALTVMLIQTKQENKELKQQVRDLTVMITAERAELPEPARGGENRIKSIGTFKIYHYCQCTQCCGKTDGITASGTRAREGRTVAVDPDVIPIGSTVVIDGHEYIAEDTGSAIIGNKIDVFVNSHEEALQLGVDTAEVFIKK
jgi:3D (Asp-Asp-Asp) domain-containing protein